MTFTPELIQLIFKRLVPLMEARWNHDNTFIVAGFIVGLVQERIDDELFLWERRPVTPQTRRMLTLLDYKQQMLGRVDTRYDATAQEQALLANLPLIPSDLVEIYQQRRRNLSNTLVHDFDRQHEIFKNSTVLSRGETDDDFWNKIQRSWSFQPAKFLYEDTLAKRIEIIKTVFGEGFGAQGFVFDAVLSSGDQLVYCKEFDHGWRLFIATDCSFLEIGNYETPLRFYFGIHSLRDTWPGAEDVYCAQRWPLTLNWFMPILPYLAFRSLAELELLSRFHVFAYQLIAEDYEAALRAALTEAEVMM